MKRIGPLFVFLLFAGFFSFLTWMFEIRPLRILILQHRAESFPTVEGKVVYGDVLTTHGSRSSLHYQPSLLYKFEVAGQEYTGQRYRYDGHPSYSKYASADRVVQAHPPGSALKVYYNPSDPGDALLSPGMRGDNVGIIFFGFPICMFMGYGAIKYIRVMRFSGGAMAIAGGVKIMSEEVTTRVRLPQYDPWAWSLGTVGIISFISGIVIGMWADKPLQNAEMAVLLMAVAGVVVYFVLQRRISSGSQDLIIDEAARTLQLPLTYKRRSRMQCAFSDVTGVSLKKVAHQGKSRVTYTYAPLLLITGQQPQQLTDLTRRQAESFAAWLRQKLGVAAEVEPQELRAR